MKNKGFSTVELLVSFVIIAFVAVAMFKTVLELLDKVSYYQTQSQITIAKGNVINSIQKDLNQRKLYGIDVCGCDCYDITYQDLTIKHLLVNKAERKIQYGGITEQIPDEFSIVGNLDVNRTTLTVPSGQNNTILKIYLPINSNASGAASDVNIVYQYDNRDIGNLPTYVEKTTGGVCPVIVNKPKLAPGMTAIKWSGTTEQTVNNPDTDTSWYDYANKQWANAKTADGSYWVWIPRYAYQIASGYHTLTAGTVNVKFLKNNTNTAYDNSIVSSTPTYSGSSQTNYIKHPAFTFGTTEVTGIWVTKFEMTSVTSYLKSLPNSTPKFNVSVGNMFTFSRGMEIESSYGWGTSGNGIDTHMIKNIEWGAAAYLSKSSYGIDGEVGINNFADYKTGCGAAAGSSVSPSCNAYNTATGMLASTTGNISGIYDMSGGMWEYVMGNLGNVAGSSGISPSTIDDKYIDRYTGYNSTIFGDAVYETSSSSTLERSWYGDYSYSPQVSGDWFQRGGGSTTGTGAGLFHFNGGNGAANNWGTWRVVLLVGEGL